MTREVIKRSSPKIADWALPLAEERNLYNLTNQWLNDKVRELKAKTASIPASSVRRALFINHDFIDAQDRRVMQLIDILKSRGYEVTLIAVGREKWQEDLSSNTNPGISKAICMPIYMKEYKFAPWDDPAVTLFFYGVTPQGLKQGVTVRLNQLEQQNRQVRQDRRESLKMRALKKFWRFRLVREFFYRFVFALPHMPDNSELKIYNIEQNLLPLTQAEVNAALSLGKNFDVIVVADLPSLPGVILKHVFGAQLIYDAHELYPEQIVFNKEAKFFLSFWESFCLRHADFVLTTSQWTAAFIENSYRLPKGSVEHFSNAPAFPPVAPVVKGAVGPLRKTIGAGTDSKILLFHGGINRFRNIGLLIDAFAKMATPNVSLVFLGSGDYGRYKGRAESSGVTNIHFLPAVSQNVLAPWVQDADAVFIPYPAVDHNTRICTPNKLYDCLQLSVPVLANIDLDVLGDIFAQYKVGLQFRTDTPENMAADLDDILRENRLDDIRRHGDFEGARRDFGWESQIKRIESILDSVGFSTASLKREPLSPPIAKAG